MGEEGGSWKSEEREEIQKGFRPMRKTTGGFFASSGPDFIGAGGTP